MSPTSPPPLTSTGILLLTLFTLLTLLPIDRGGEKKFKHAQVSLFRV
jgi:hypothetical protein